MTKAVNLANLASGEALTVDETNDRVGIASTSPDATLDVKNTILMDGDAGIITATSFVGDGSSLTGVANTDFIVGTAITMVKTNFTDLNVSGSATVSGQLSIGGTINYEDVTNVDSVGVVTARIGIKVLAGGINAVGVITGTSFKGDGSALTGIAATDTIAAASLTVSGISTLSNTKIGIGKSINFGSVQKASIQDHSVGLGTTTRDGRDAGIGTAIGEMVMVTDDYTHGTQICVYCGDVKGWVGVTTEKIARSLQASGGNVEVDEGGYKRHIFTSPGNFVVSSTIPTSNTVDVLVVAGGGAGGGSSGNGQAGGGGAGGFRLASNIPVSSATYPVTVGAGGAGAAPNPGATGANGANSVFGISPAITATGGGGGGGFSPSADNYVTANPGGSGGGKSGGGDGGEGNAGGNDPRCSPIAEGSDGGGPIAHNQVGAGGGGAGQAGLGNGQTLGTGGAGAPVPSNIAPTSYGTPGPSPGRYFAGGGSGAWPTVNAGGAGGGGSSGASSAGGDATTNTGGGGGGAQGPMGNNYAGGSGGPGIVIIAYAS